MERERERDRRIDRAQPHAVRRAPVKAPETWQTNAIDFIQFLNNNCLN